jgi:hypothetical protein
MIHLKTEIALLSIYKCTFSECLGIMLFSLQHDISYNFLRQCSTTLLYNAVIAQNGKYLYGIAQRYAFVWMSS